MPFSPTDIAGCKLWLDAGTLSLSDGDPIGTWTDGSGTGNASGSGSARPTYKTNVVNGLPVARFDGSDDALTFANRTVSDFSLFVVVKQTGDGAILAQTGSSAPQTRVGQGGSNVLSTYDGSNNPQSGTLGVAQGTFSLLEIIRSGSTVTFYQNGTGYGTGTMSGSQTFNQFGAFVVSSNDLNGDAPEVVLFDSALGTTDRQSMENYEGAKYNLGFGGSPPPPPSTFIGARFQTVGGSSQTFSGGVAR